MSTPPENKPPEGPKRDEKGRLLPGSTGNPGGRSKRVQRARRGLEKGLPEAVDVLLGLIRAPRRTDYDDAEGVSDRDKLAGIRLLLEFTVVKPKTEVEVNGTVSPLAGLTREDLLAIIKGGK